MTINKDYPKILVIGQPFNKKTGGGITISNLFHNWPKENIAVTNNGKIIARNDFSICNQAYILGDREYKIKFPFNLFFRKYSSGFIKKTDHTDSNEISKANIFNKSRALIYELFENLFYFLDLNFLIFRMEISKEFLDWIDEYNPDIIYTHLAKIEIIYFVNELKKRKDFPLVIHIMDDWPKKMARGIFAKYWQKKTESNFISLIQRANLLLSVSDEMSKEYLQRYNRHFHTFHNPIEILKWLPEKKTDWKNKVPFHILYTGRIGFSNSESVKDLCEATEVLRIKGYNIILNLYSPDVNKHRAEKLSKYKSVRLYPSILHDQMPKLLNMNDLLILPLDFNKWGIDYAKLSMPTKASEYMISGTPIIVYAPSVMALTKHAENNNWGYVVKERNINKLCQAIALFIDDPSIRKEYGLAAHKFATEHYDAELVREKFRSSISSLLSC